MLAVAAVSQDRTGSVIQIPALQALALAASGEETGAVDALATALGGARPCPRGRAWHCRAPGPAGEDSTGIRTFG
jgi:hypothetical protein